MPLSPYHHFFTPPTLSHHIHSTPQPPTHPHYPNPPPKKLFCLSLFSSQGSASIMKIRYFLGRLGGGPRSWINATIFFLQARVLVKRNRLKTLSRYQTAQPMEFGGLFNAQRLIDDNQAMPRAGPQPKFLRARLRTSRLRVVLSGQCLLWSFPS